MLTLLRIQKPDGEFTYGVDENLSVWGPGFNGSLEPFCTPWVDKFQSWDDIRLWVKMVRGTILEERILNAPV